jgi:hypothetical protein
MRKEREIGEWLDTEGHICCVHANKKKAEETIDRIRHLEEQGIEVYLPMISNGSRIQKIDLDSGAYECRFILMSYLDNDRVTSTGWCFLWS